VSEVRLHPNFRFTPQADRYDVAILVLDRQVQYRNNIKPICLPQKDASFLGRVAYVAGWGALQAGKYSRPFPNDSHITQPIKYNFINPTFLHVCLHSPSKGSKLRPKVLQHVNVPVIENNVCELWHRKRGINIKIHDEMMCAGYEFGGRDACQVRLMFHSLCTDLHEISVKVIWRQLPFLMCVCASNVFSNGDSQTSTQLFAHTTLFHRPDP
jgi:transmembrane serine protease 6